MSEKGSRAAAYGSMNDEAPAPPYSEQDTANVESPPEPPTYTDTQNEAPPPTYESLYGEIQEARRNATSGGGFLKNVCFILFSTIGFTIFIAVLLAIPVAMITIGAINIGNCPLQRLIPIWLIVGGSVAALMQIASIWKRIRAQCKGQTEEEQNQNEGNRAYNSCSSLLACFNMAWFFAGNVWVYKHFPLSEIAGEPSCDPVTYYFAFWIITSVYIVVGLVCCCSCCIAICGASK